MLMLEGFFLAIEVSFAINDQFLSNLSTYLCVGDFSKLRIDFPNLQSIKWKLQADQLEELKYFCRVSCVMKHLSSWYFLFLKLTGCLLSPITILKHAGSFSGT